MFRLLSIIVSFTAFIVVSSPVFSASIVTIDIEITKEKQTKKTTEIVTIDGEKARLDFLRETKGKTEQTPYLLTVDGGKSWVLGNTHSGEYYCATVDAVAFIKEIGTIVTAIVALVNPKFLEIKVDKKKEEPGPNISGFSTNYVRLVTSAEAEADILFNKYQYSIKITDDVWYTSELEIEAFRKRWLEALTQSGYEKLDEMFTNWAKELPGPILKLESEIVLTNVLKNESTVQKEKTSIASVKEVKSSDIPQQTFAMPKCKNITQIDLEWAVKELAKEGKLTL
ncbi:MAG: hypothetical protein AMJ53_01845 [Gammaproteobacteria bacterium SG8_11]|nr:MAG: hypothetical protein AMJ53_01845 [Gammaproteobacteria bacterium SG8_11]